MTTHNISISSATAFKRTHKGNDHSEAISLLKEENKLLSNRFLKLEEEFKALKESLATPVSGERKKTLLGRNASQSEDIRVAYHTYVKNNDQGITGWDVDFSLCRSINNKTIVDNIVKSVKLKQENVPGSEVYGKFKLQNEKILLGRIRSFYEGEKRKHFNTDMTEEEVASKKTRDAKSSRKKELRNKRIAAFHGNRAHIIAEFGTEQECMSLLDNKEYMSDEEALDFENGYASSFKVLSPSWRSEKANDFYLTLDQYHKREKRSRSLPRSVREVVTKNLSDELLLKIPSWAVINPLLE